MGTPEFAIPCLESLVNSRHTIVGIVTASDKPSGRGLALTESAVKKFAITYNLPLFQPLSINEDSFLSWLRNLHPELFVVVAFRILPREIWALPPLGTINLHASLLPQYRGAAPINHAIMNGETFTGVTTFFIDDKIDTGDILMQEKIAITDSDDAGTLHDKLMVAGAGLILKTVDAIAEGNIKPIKQPVIENEIIKKAPKIFRQDCKIDWNKPSTAIYNFIRGLSPYPGAWTELKIGENEKIILKIFRTEKPSLIQSTSGEIVIREGNRLFFGCKDHALEVLEVQAEGKKRMPASQFLLGRNRDLYGF